MEIEKSLTNLFELDGVRGTFVLDPKGQVLRSRAHAIYDQETLQRAASSVSKALDSMQVQHGEWNSTQIHFSDGKLLLRSLGQYILGVIADSSTNVAFANVALNVAAKKITEVIESKPIEAVAAAAAAAPSAQAPAAQPHLNVSGLSMSASGLGLSASGSAPPIHMSDEVNAFVTRCVKALAKSVGPMSKVIVKETVRGIALNGELTRDQLRPLVKALEEKIEAVEERSEFRNRLGM
ncbi:MAG: roadblock/LC7 domain-containing protein [Deltaproteobacteria bacterium]|nr:roadblock/LC7 domain-containing protein [Deltaproteobacteria bacterium]